MANVYIKGASGRLGSALVKAFTERGDKVSDHHARVNYAVFAHRYRGDDDIGLEFASQVIFTLNMMERLQPNDGDCAIIVVSSIVAENPTLDASVSYVTCKAALNAMARYRALLSDVTGYRVNIVSPGAFTGKNPPVKMQSVVNNILFLCSSSGALLNGCNISIDR